MRGRRHGIPEQRPRGACDGADRVVRGELAKHSRQAVERHERAREEREREDDDEDDALRRVRRADDDAEERADQQHREGEQQQQREAGERVRQVRVDAPADDQAAEAQHDDAERDRRHLREQVADQVGRARHRQRAEAVDDPLVQVRRDRCRRPHDPEGERLDEHAADHVLAVAAAGHVDHAAEDVGEEQHEHHRLQRHVEQLLGDLPDVLEVAAGEREAVEQEVACAIRRPRIESRGGEVGGHALRPPGSTGRW